MTEQQIKNLRTAIDKAILPGGCNYTTGDVPACVIGQLGYLEGASVEELSSWHGTVNVLFNHSDKAGRLKDYDPELLTVLQCIWDEHWPKDSTEDEASTKRKEMSGALDERLAENANA